MGNPKKIKMVAISGLQEMYDYKVEFNDEGNTAILIAPNGFGKTAFLAVLNSCMRFQLSEAADYRFDELNVYFNDKTRWLFKKTLYADETFSDKHHGTTIRPRIRRRRRGRSFIKFTFFDAKGKAKDDKNLSRFKKIPPEVLARALDWSLPVNRIAVNTFHDLQIGDSVKIEELIERYHDILFEDLEFREQIGEFAPELFQGIKSSSSCVFIETQRLLQSVRSNLSEEEQETPQEEILRQADFLAKLLQRTYASYAAISQDLDRSFPNRLIARAEGPGLHDVQGLKEELNDIEARRKALTAAGILVDTAELVVAPKDEFIRSVADALQIYVEDSKKKLETFDEVFVRVAVFRDLLSKKLRPKELVINRESGVEIRRGKEVFSLDKLSSGEKHEFVMLFRLIFETARNSLVLIDEPEISLHVSWQLEFMSDLAKIQHTNNFQCIIATHSPQIIQGAENITFDLSEQVK